MFQNAVTVLGLINGSNSSRVLTMEVTVVGFDKPQEFRVEWVQV